mmetsp:Transcript_7111/g.9835  ORF Transcript_7111/g.9835 Transcript_7111/m.9835 type:complete len:799 (-) Transcript_7111:365-2761(-)
MAEMQRIQQLQAVFNDNKRIFMELLEFDQWHGKYGEKLKQMIEQSKKRLYVSLDDLQEFKKDMHKNLLKSPSSYLPAFEQAVKEAIQVLDTNNEQNAKDPDIEYFVGIEGSFGSHHVSPRQLAATFIGSLVLVEGIVTKCSVVRPKLVKSVHHCAKTNEQHVRYYRDAISHSLIGSTTGGSGMGFPTSTSYPTKDDQGNPLSSEYGLSVYRDHQMITIQEMPEKAPAGQLPCSVDVILENDLVDKVKPGDRIQVCGIYKGLPQKPTGHSTGLFRTVIVANNVKLLAKEIAGPVITDQDIKNIKKASQKQNVFEALSQSLAPSIYGHEYIKKAVLLLLLGGAEKNLENKTHLRGDINILLIGDPSTAKSQMLRFVLHTAPLAISTTGKGASGVGLTASVVHDTETGERRLEAGAMVLADRGVVCIDEFDKMDTDDRVAIHEVMEQQTVTIAKAGIHATLNARCSVLAAANPIYGQYDRHKKPTENIALPDSLLSRFDLLFILLDNLNPEHDRLIADHVLRMHRYKSIAEDESGSHDIDIFDTIHEVNEEEEEESTPVFQKYDKLLHGNKKKQEIFSIPFIKKYILYAKTKVTPVLTDEARNFINNAYANLRSKDNMKTLPITTRTLETIIRLATAHAKCRLSQEVAESDAAVAMEIMNYALFHDTTVEDLQPLSNNNNNNNNDNQPKNKRPGVPPQSNAKRQRTDVSQPQDDTAANNSSDQNNNQPAFAPPRNRKSDFSKRLNSHFQAAQIQTCTRAEIDIIVNKNNSQPFSEEEIAQYLKQLEDDGRFMVADDVVVLI